MAGINVDLKGLGDRAVEIKTSNAILKENFNTLKHEMSNLTDVWKSSSQNALMERFKNIDKITEDFSKDLDKYADFLINVAEQYGYMEEKINKNAESFTS